MGFSFFGSSSAESKGGHDMWQSLSSIEEVKQIIADSHQSPQVIFKHSTRCIISRSVLKNFESDWNTTQTNAAMHFLDLLAHRDVSNAIAELTSVYHQSPQLLVLQEGKVTLDRSHDSIDATELSTHLAS